MPLISAADFPQINAQPDRSGLANGLFQALTGIRQQAQFDKQQQAVQLKEQLKTTGAQFLRLRGINDLTTQRTELAKLAQAAVRRGEDISLFEEGLAIENPDEMNLFLTRIATRATDADKILEAELVKGQENKLQFGAQDVFEDTQGNQFFGTSRRNPQTGEVEAVLSPIGHDNAPAGDVNLVSQAGLTPEGKVRQSREIAEDRGDIRVDTETDIESKKLDLQQEKQPGIEAAKSTEKGKVSRNQRLVDQGLEAADGLANINRGLELLENVETGGLANLQQQAKRLFGVEGADEAELSNRLSKAVLSQLRATFGAAFTEREGSRLERIEASFGKSTQGNIRLLEQAKRIVVRASKRGIKAAEALGDTDAANDIRESLEFTLSTTSQALTPGELEELQELEAQFGNQ